LVRYNKDGTLDHSFDEDGKVVTEFGSDAFVRTVAVQANGKIMVAGATKGVTNLDYALAWYNSDGSVDEKFHPKGKQVGFVPRETGSLSSITVQTDGKKLVAGNTYDSQGRPNFLVARFTADG